MNSKGKSNTDKKGSIKKTESEDSKIIEFIDFDSLSNEELIELDGLDLLTPRSKETFQLWCDKIKVPQKVDLYNPLIMDHEGEIVYRKARDDEHKFRDITMSIFRKSKVQYRNNHSVIPIDTSSQQVDRAYRITHTLLNSIRDLRGNASVGYGEEDKLDIHLFEYTFSFSMTEVKVKRRSLMSSASQENKVKTLRPMYEGVFSGRLVIKFEEIIDHWNKGNKPSFSIEFGDSIDATLETQLGDIFKELYKIASKVKISNFISIRERDRKEKEGNRLRQIEEQNRRQLKCIEEQNNRKQQLVQNIEQQMENWFLSQKLYKYAEELQLAASSSNDQTAKELLFDYISLVRQKAEKCDPVTDIIDQVKAIGVKGLIL